MYNFDTKVCRRCEKILPLEEFYLQKKSGRSNYCKQCTKERSKERAEENRICKEYNLKKCTKCKQYKTLSEYYTRGQPGLYRGDCKLCVLQRQEQKAISRVLPTEDLVCKTCCLQKPISEFNKKVTNFTGFQYNCKECQALIARETLLKRLKDNLYEIPLEKKCSKCKTKKSIDCFSKRSITKDGHDSTCKECENKQAHERGQKIKLENLSKENGNLLIEKKCTKCKQTLPIDSFNRNVYTKTGFNYVCKACLKIERLDPRKIQIRRNWQNNKRKTDPVFRIKDNLRRKCKKVLLKGSKSASTLELLGCDGGFWMSYLEKLFWPGMTRENYGKEWTVDHIIPLENFNLLDPEEQKKAFNYTNTQPLWWDDNGKKTSRLDWTPAESKYELPERLKAKYGKSNAA